LPKRKSFVFHCRFNDVASDFVYEVLSLKLIIKALKFFQLPDSHMYLHLKTVYKSFVYFDLFHKYRIDKLGLYNEKDVFIELAKILKEENLKNYSAKNIMVKDILVRKNLKTINEIFKNKVDVNLFFLMVNFPENRRIRPATQAVLTHQNNWRDWFKWLYSFGQNDNQIIPAQPHPPAHLPAQPHPPAQQNPAQAEQDRLKLIKVVVKKTSSLGERLLKHLKSAIIDNEHSIFIRFFADGLQTLKDLQFLQKIVRLESYKQKILLRYIEKYTASSKYSWFLIRSGKNVLPLCFFKEIEIQFWSNRAFVDLVAELLRSNPSSKVPTDTLDISQKTTKHLKVIESIFCDETLVHNFTDEKFQIMKDLFLYSDWVEEILKVVLSKSLNSSINETRCIEVLKSIPDIQKQREISHILKSNENELADLKAVTTLLLNSLLSKRYVDKILKINKEERNPLSLNHAITLGMIYLKGKEDVFWKVLGMAYLTIPYNMVNDSNIGNRIVNKKVNLPCIDKYLRDLLGDFKSEPFMSATKRTKPDSKNINNDMGGILDSVGKVRRKNIYKKPRRQKPKKNTKGYKV
jgi:hypothetical protein